MGRKKWGKSGAGLIKKSSFVRSLNHSVRPPSQIFGKHAPVPALLTTLASLAFSPFFHFSCYGSKKESPCWKLSLNCFFFKMCCQSLALLKVLLPNFQAGTGASSQKLHFLWKLSLSLSCCSLDSRILNGVERVFVMLVLFNNVIFDTKELL